MKPRVCPKCHLPQQWEMWRLCPCGYDFGPPRPDYKPDPAIPVSAKPEKVISISDWPSPQEAVRSIRRAMIASWAVLGGSLVGGWYFATMFRESSLFVVAWCVGVLLASWLRRRVPGPAKVKEISPWIAGIWIACAVALIVASFLDYRWLVESMFAGLCALFAYIIVRALIEEVRLFRNPLSEGNLDLKR